MQALETLAAVHAVFEKAGENLNVETSEGDVFYADGCAPMDEFNELHHNQEHMRGVLHDSQESLGNAFIDFNVACRGLEDAQLLPYLMSVLLSHHSSGSLLGALSLASRPIPTSFSTPSVHNSQRLIRKSAYSSALVRCILLLSRTLEEHAVGNRPQKDGRSVM